MALDLNELAADVDSRFGKKGTRIAERSMKHATKLERKLEQRAKQLPVDTPLDRARRARTARRSTRVVLVVLAIGGGIALYRAWKSQQRDALPAESGPTSAADLTPDVFGNGLQRSNAEAFARAR